MSKTQLARGIWTDFPPTEDPFATPDGMVANLRLIDDHLALYTLAGPVPATTTLPSDARQGAGQIFVNGTYAVLNAAVWQMYPARIGLRAIELGSKTEYINIGASWQVVAQKSEKTYLTRAVMQADTTQPVGTQGVVTNDPAHTAENPINGYYTWTSAAWVRNAYQPANQLDLDETILETQRLASLISGSSATEPLEAVTDQESGGIHRMMTPSFHEDRVHRVEEVSGGAALVGDDGGVSILHDEKGMILGPMEIAHTDAPGVFVVDEEGGVHAALAGDLQEVPEEPVIVGPLDEGILFSGANIAAAKGQLVELHVPSMLVDRNRAAEVIASISSDSLPISAAGDDLVRFVASDFGSGATISIRSRNGTSDRLSKRVGIKTFDVPVAAAPTVKVLLIGDSIGNRQGPQLMQQVLTEWGVTAEWVGTLNSSASASNSNDATGPVNESREGWETGDFTLAVNDRVTVIQPGQEAAYLAMSKTDKWPRNPFLRVATPDDAPADVRNGHVMDFAFYQARFALQAPDIVIWSLGTNDVRDRAEGTIEQDVRDNDALAYRRMRAAWPAVKVIRALPGTAIDPSRNALWSTKYKRMFAGMFAAANEAGAIVAPSWALVNHDVGYNWTSSPVDASGFTRQALWTDPVHPVGYARSALYRSLAAYVAAAALNLL